MSEKRCKSCNAIIQDGENYCLFCGTKQDEIVQTNPDYEEEIRIEKANKKAMILRTLMFICLGIIALILQSNLFNIIAIMISYKMYKDRNKNISGKDQIKIKSTFKQKVFILGILAFYITLGIIAFNLINTKYTVEEESEEYTYEVEPGYEYIKPIKVDEMTNRIEIQIRKATENYENITAQEINDQFIISFDIHEVSYRDEAIQVFKQIVSNILSSNINYPYIKDLNVHYYNKGDYLYSARFYNIFLKEMNHIETDGEFYDYQSNLSVLFKTLDAGFKFPDSKIDYNEQLTESAEKYLVDYDEWYGDFDVLSQEIYQEFDDVSNRFIDDKIEPTQDEIKNLEYLIRQYSYRCTSFNRIETDVYYEVFHQYFSRGCQYYIRAYKHNLDGLKNLNIDRIMYSYLDYNIAYDYFEQIFGYEDNLEGNDI